MTEHSIEELQRQRNNAKSRYEEARINLAAAEKRLHDAMCSESGLIGKMVTDKRKKVSIVVHDIEFSRGKPWALKGFAVKSDGKVGLSERRVWADDADIEVGA